jgi:basic membrane protein A
VTSIPESKAAPLARDVSRRVFGLSCGALLAAAGVGGPASSFAAGSQPTRVVLLLSGVVVDGGWSQLAYEGLERLRRQPVFQVAFAEDVTLAQMQQVARGYSDDGFDLVIGHGFEFTSALLDIAPDYPKQHFFVTSFAPQGRIPNNIQFIDLGYFDAAYAAGALAALISEHKHAVGFVGGEDDPTQQKIRRAFIAGAERTVPGIKGLGIITGDYNNAAKGREAASTLTGNGADVIWHAADVTGLGAIQGAIAGKAKMLGCYSDQTSLAPEQMAASFEMNLSGMVAAIGESVANRSFAGGTEWKPTVDKMWLLKAGAHGSYNPTLVRQAEWAAFEKIWRDLSTRRINTASILAV